VENAGVGDRGGKCRTDNGWKAVRKEKKNRAYKIPTGYCDNYCKDTKAVPVPEYAYMPTVHESSI